MLRQGARVFGFLLTIIGAYLFIISVPNITGFVVLGNSSVPFSILNYIAMAFMIVGIGLLIGSTKAPALEHMVTPDHQVAHDADSLKKLNDHYRGQEKHHSFDFVPPEELQKKYGPPNHATMREKVYLYHAYPSSSKRNRDVAVDPHSLRGGGFFMAHSASDAVSEMPHVADNDLSIMQAAIPRRLYPELNISESYSHITDGKVFKLPRERVRLFNSLVKAGYIKLGGSH